jgi:hypothetical protein
VAVIGTNGVARATWTTTTLTSAVQLIMSGVTTDITSGTGENLTLQAASSGTIVLDDTVTINGAVTVPVVTGLTLDFVGASGNPLITGRTGNVNAGGRWFTFGSAATEVAGLYNDANALRLGSTYSVSLANGFLISTAQSVTDDATFAVTPTAANIEGNCTTGGGCNGTLSDTGTAGSMFEFTNISANTITFARSAGVLETPSAAAIVLVQYAKMRCSRSVAAEWICDGL